MKNFTPSLRTGLSSVLLLLSFYSFSQYNASSSLASTVTTAVNGGQSTAWTNATNVQSDDGLYATCFITGANKPSYHLDSKGWGFQSTTTGQANYIPPGATINGVEVYVKLRKTNVGNIRDNEVILLKNGATAGTSKARGKTLWQSTATTIKFGSSVDLWGTTWTATDLINANFGVRISAKTRSNKTAQAEIDHIRIIVYFNQIFYYSKAAGNLETFSTWGTNTDGSGSAPTNFTNNGQVFFLRNRAAASLTAGITITGTNSRMVVGDGVTATTLTIPAAFALVAPVDINAASALVINNTTHPTLANIADNTTVTYGAAGDQTVQEATYYNLSASGSGTKTLESGTNNYISVNNIFSIGSGITFNNDSKNVTVFGTGTGFSVSGTASGAGRYTYSASDADLTLGGSSAANISNLEVDLVTTTGPARTLTIANPTTITGTFYLTEGTVTNGTNLTMNSGSTVSVRDGILSSSISGSSGYNVHYLSYATSSPKTTANELTGTIQNLTVETGSGFSVALNRNLSLSGNLTITSGTLDASASNYAISLGGNFSNSGTFTPQSNTVSFTGSGVQSIGGTGTQNFYNLVINRTAVGTVTLNAPVTVTNGLTLTNGTITSSAVNLLTYSGSAISGGNSNSYVNGPLTQTISSLSATRVFPIGKAFYKPITLSVTQVAASSTSYTTEQIESAPTTRTLPAALTKVSAIRYHTLSSSNAANLSSGTITINYDANDWATDPPSLRVAKSSGASWVNLGGVGSGIAPGTITSGAFTTLGEFVLSNALNGSNLLPLKWLSFSGKLVSGKAELVWETASEFNVEYFEVERKSPNAEWKAVGKLPAKNASLNSYRFVDATIPAGSNQYRIKEVDVDNRVVYTKTILIESNSSKGGIIIASNPVRSGAIKILVQEDELLQAGRISVRVFDMNGRLSLSRETRATNLLEIPSHGLNAGKYILVLSGPSGRQFTTSLLIL